MPTAGYRESARTFILWEGVTNYLTEAAVDTTLRWCARAAPGSLLLFTYVHRDVLTRPGAFVGTERLFATLAKAREKLTLGIEPGELPEFLRNAACRWRATSAPRSIGSVTSRTPHARCAGMNSIALRWPV